MERVVRLVKICWLGFWVGLVTFVFFFPTVVTARLDPGQKKTDIFLRLWARILLAVTRVKTRSRGVEKIESGRSYVVICNHQSHFDVLALVAELPLSIRWVIKKELRKIPFFGYGTEAMGCIYVDRSNTAQAVRSLQTGVRALPPGSSLLFFAEGTRSADGTIGPFKKGGFRTAQVAGWPILPVVVRGSRKVLPKGEIVFRSGTIEVEVLDPVSEQEVASRDWEEIMEEVRERIVRAFNAPGP